MPESRTQQLIILVRELRALYRHLYNTRPTTKASADDPSLTHSQSELLEIVANHKEGITTADLAHKLRVSSGAITQAVDHLTKKELLVRQENPKDRRSVLICLKQPFQPEVSFEMFYAKHVSPLFADISDIELQQLITLVNKVKK